MRGRDAQDGVGSGPQGDGISFRDGWATARLASAQRLNTAAPFRLPQRTGREKHSAGGAGASTGVSATGADGSGDTKLSLGAVRVALFRLRGRRESVGRLGFFLVIVEGQFARGLGHITPLPLKVSRSVTAPAIAGNGRT